MAKKDKYYDGKIENPKNPTHHNLNSLYLTGEFFMEMNHKNIKYYSKNKIK